MPRMYEEVRSNLWNNNVESDRQNLSYETALLEQYKLYVEMADRVSHRRAMANTFFLSVNSLVVIVISGYSINPSEAPVWVWIFPLIILEGMCLAWFWIVRSYRQLNTAKWAVVGALEEQLPASPWWKAEWAGLGGGKDRSKYWPLTHLEQWIPSLFAITYLAAFVTMLMVGY